MPPAGRAPRGRPRRAAAGTPAGTAPAATSAPPSSPAAPSQPAPVPAPAAGARPGPGNTGVPAGTSLTPSGGLRITQPNTVVDAKDITGSVSIEASNVTIRNSTIHGSPTDDYGVLVRSGSVTIVDSEISGFSNGIAGNGWTATRVDLHGLADDGVKLDDDVTLQDSWIHDMAPPRARTPTAASCRAAAATWWCGTT